MKTKDIAAKYGFDLEEFERFLRTERFSMGGIVSNTLADEYVAIAAEGFEKKRVYENGIENGSLVYIQKVADEHGFNNEEFKDFLLQYGFIKPTKYNDAFAKSDIPEVVRLYQNHLKQLEEEKSKDELVAMKLKQRELEKPKAIASMLITSGFNFDGYTIKKYSGYISGDDAIQINRDDLFKDAGQVLTDALVKIRIQALKELKEAAYDLGCNAVIGVDFDYMTFEPETIGVGGIHYYEPYVICVTANGNAVIIDKN